ncbi:UDP-N-acetylglucosamine 2-epimerase (non-hydrolyzing) [Polynucleobacter paneuropaeus]|nr:UDP-N-acetylglucosamine 2-epimerase (non-hydrolyzing) [Polynucleobacter paneuropaeus]
MKLMLIFGTRPELIKLAPMIIMAKNDPSIELVTCSTGQHRQMLDQALDVFNIKQDMDLDVMTANQSLAALTAKLMIELSQAIEKVKPDALVVQGDTTSAYMGALAAFYQQIPVAHVEAGLRTGDLQSPFPEELNRAMIGRIAKWHFAPTKAGKENLLAEGISKNSIYVTGNTVVDAIQILAGSATAIDALRNKSSIIPKQDFVLVTAHRRENHGDGMSSICKAIKEIAHSHPKLEFIFPVHLNPNVRKTVMSEFADHPQVILIEPVDFQTLLYLESVAKLIITDSGGIQEEAPSFCTPVVVTREHTERVEGIKAGFAKLAGIQSESIVKLANQYLENTSIRSELSKSSNPYGDGKATERIYSLLQGKPTQEFIG